MVVLFATKPLLKGYGQQSFDRNSLHEPLYCSSVVHVGCVIEHTLIQGSTPISGR